MTVELEKRLAALKEELVHATAEERKGLLEHLQQAVDGLSAKGVEAPVWARARLNDCINEEVEDQFDNMPI